MIGSKCFSVDSETVRNNPSLEGWKDGLYNT